ncbi:hypothetical protein HUT16_16710 [Kitasatospora sp. NA04385]|uniref:hypothetical protein n=1 Tax=Kitasatospora sp. NA04385 TaxID=2742135 RepID=UPI001590B491|nr:hypothetical protein [Kitasatospora sp. NA04385]QKW20492.1 hypothetical protein HUT16_16710 [Kitasatospora sp. NA04385]
MPKFSPSTLAFADDVADRRDASDGFSRFGAYLGYNASLLHEDGDLLSAQQFAFAAWQTATAPVMSPGYVRVRPDLHSLTLVSYGEDLDQVAVRIDVPLRHHQLAAAPDHRLSDWQRDVWATDGAFTALEEPRPTGRSALLITATLLLPVPTYDLITPTVAAPGPRMTMQAKDAVNSLVGFVNMHAHLVNDLAAGGVR